MRREALTGPVRIAQDARVEDYRWQGKPLAFALASALVAGLLGVAWFTASDRARYRDLELIGQPTGVGDTPGLDLGGRDVPATSLGSFGGKPFYAAEEKPRKFRDSEMLRAGRADGDGATIYRPEEGAEAGSDFLKTAPGRYVRIGPSPFSESPQATPAPPAPPAP